MGRAARWLRGLLREKKSVEGGLPPENPPAKEKKRWGFVKLFRESDKGQQLRGKGSDREERGNYERDADDQRMRAIAAVAAASQAAVTVVRITSCSGRSVGFGAVAGVKLEEWAAIKIQAVYRGYLARRALRALRGLVKLQALVRGNIVRKQAAETLRCMQSLLRVQSRARALRSESSKCRAGRSIPGPEKYEPTIQSSKSIKRKSSEQTRMDAIYENGDRFADWNWLDQWMEERYGDSREVSKGSDDDKNAKILEVDTGKPPQFISRQSLVAMPDSKDSTAAATAAKLSIPTPSSSVRMTGRSPSPQGLPIVDFLSSPQLFSATSDPEGPRGAFTPAKSECSRSVFGGCSDYRNYMANTESSRAKERSQSAPRHRPEYKKSSSMKRLSDHGLSGQLLPPPEAACSSGWRSALHFQFAKKKYPGSGRLDRLGMP